LTEALKRIAGDAVPEKFRGSIATEKDVMNVEELKTSLKEKGRRLKVL